MAKVRVRFVCQQCGADAGRWFGRCAGCGAWNSCVEEKAAPEARGQKYTAQLVKANPPQPITEVVGGWEDRVETTIGEFDRTLGGGALFRAWLRWSAEIRALANRRCCYKVLRSWLWRA